MRKNGSLARDFDIRRELMKVNAGDWTRASAQQIRDNPPPHTYP